MTTREFNDPPTPLQKLGSIALYCGVMGGIIGSGALLYSEVIKANKGLLATIIADREIGLSLIFTFLLPTAIGYLVRVLFSERDQ